MSYEDDLKENAALGVSIIKQYLKGEISGSEKIRIAGNAVSQYNKHMATKGAIDTIRFAVGRSLSSNIEELKDYIQGQMPEYTNKKAIE